MHAWEQIEKNKETRSKGLEGEGREGGDTRTVSTRAARVQNASSGDMYMSSSPTIMPMPCV